MVSLPLEYLLSPVGISKSIVAWNKWAQEAQRPVDLPSIDFVCSTIPLLAKLKCSAWISLLVHHGESLQTAADLETTPKICAPAFSPLRAYAFAAHNAWRSQTKRPGTCATSYRM